MFFLSKASVLNLVCFDWSASHYVMPSFLIFADEGTAAKIQH